MKKEEINFLIHAHEFLENPSFITKVTDKLGKPIEFVMNKLSEESKHNIANISEKALRKSLEVAQQTIFENEKEDDFEKIQKTNNLSRIGHNIATMATGAVGGFFGEASLLIELPITTTLIMRSILSQGQSYTNFTKEELITNSIYVFSLGSPKSDSDDEMDSSYYTSRIMMDYSVKKAAEFLAINGPKTVLKNIEAGSAPFLLELITQVANRFNVTVTEKMLVEAIPVVGALGGAGINLLFTDFFTNSARFHFGIKRLESIYGKEVVQNEYIKSKKKSEAA